MVVVIGAELVGPRAGLRRRIDDGVARAPAAGVAVDGGEELSGVVAAGGDGGVTSELASGGRDNVSAFACLFPA